MNLKAQRQLQRLECVQVRKRVQHLRVGRILMLVLKRSDLVQVLESQVSVKILSFSQVLYCFVQKEKADQIEMVAWPDLFLWNYWEMLKKR